MEQGFAVSELQNDEYYNISLEEINTGPCGKCDKDWRCNFKEKYRAYRFGYCDFKKEYK